MASPLVHLVQAYIVGYGYTSANGYERLTATSGVGIEAAEEPLAI